MNGNAMQDDLEINKGSEIKTNIEKLIYGGDGFTHIGSRACFVENAVPGDEIIAEIKNIKKQYLNASIKKILKRSTKRIAPPCPYHMNCGGCQWQHIDYNYQLYWKQEILNESLERIGNLSNIKINKIVPSPKQFNYRTRTIMQLNGKKTPPGYFMRNSHKMIPIKSCMLLEEPINTALLNLSEKIQRIAESQEIKDVEFLYLKHSHEVIISFNSSSYRKRIKPLIYDCDKKKIIEKTDLVEQIKGLNFFRSQRRFYQINSQQNINMIKLVSQFFAELDNPDILDLYCGCGNFSLFLANLFFAVVGFFGLKYVARVALVPQGIVGPVVAALAIIGAYSFRNMGFDIWIMFAMGLFGYLLRKADYPLAPIILGIILGPMAEENLDRVLTLAQAADLSLMGYFMQRWLTIALMVLTLVTLVYSFIRENNLWHRKKPEHKNDVSKTG